ncbi:hypothetical protein [Herbaspirillum sp. SJZ107]|uniref:hypothetical protein n=1 Tax=Herbaspirillum sp. SJZ107 TaxID=2572881 RepID=UPI00114FFCF0|nr:hypothetical protein [Herbaspirillum sp. SJZ107]TQK10201.1 hypothetical protein FBX97_0117 [Herbaspirillum sp. SJZ107]
MGTRADFYVGKGKNAEWLGSIGWDGYPDGITEAVRSATDEASYRAAVSSFFAARNDVTLPEHGWPWPWNDSGTTDYSYWHFDGKTMASGFGGGLFACDEEEPEDDDDLEVVEMPDMSARKKVAAAGSDRSGVIAVGG